MAGHRSGACGFSVRVGDGDVMASRLNFTDKAIDELMDAMLYSPRDPIETADLQWGFIDGTRVVSFGNLTYIVPWAGTLWETVKLTITSTFF